MELHLPPPTKVLIVENFTASLGFTIEELYGMGSIARQDVARHTGKIEVSFKCFSIDLTADESKNLWHNFSNRRVQIWNRGMVQYRKNTS